MGWLIILLLFHFFTGRVLKSFEDGLKMVVALMFFVPMLLDTGGNAGVQAAITVIRSLAIGDVTLRNFWKIVRMELFASLPMGIIVGTIAFLGAFTLQRDLLLAIVVGSTMFSVILLAIATGISLPMISKKIGLDPACLAGPITTSIVDLIALIIYFRIAQFFLPVLRY